jgi:hydroxymethylbilane synthase
VIGAMPPRANPADVLVSRSGLTLRDLPTGASVGTSSLRRSAQLWHLRPDLKIVDIRGNVDTRVRKAHDPDGPYDAIVLAQAGVERLGRTDAITEAIPLEDMLPAPGQGAIAVQCRDEQSTLDLLLPINHADTVAAVEAERAFLAGLGGGCALPIAAYAEVAGDRLHLRGRVIAIDGVRLIESEGIGAPDTAYSLGKELAEELLAQGAAEILESVG